MEDDYTSYQSFAAPFSYPVVFTKNVFGANAAVLENVLIDDDPRRLDALCFVDEGLADGHMALSSDIQRWFNARSDRLNLVHEPIRVAGGEAIKNDFRLAMQMVDAMLEHKLCRHSYVLVAGGGAVLDAVGFAASIVHRGLRLVRLPSTVLAQCDAGLGVKNGMNRHGGKNILGTFHPPYVVVNDLTWLNTLVFDDWIAGVAEAFKVAIIKDAEFFELLCQSANAIRQRDSQVMEQVVQRCADLHLAHIRTSGDPFELGTARPLDFGHWSAHKLEGMSNYRVSHGHAVAIGIAVDMIYAVKQGWVSEKDCEKALQGLTNCGFRLWQPEMGRRLGDGTYEILQGVEEFREHLGGQLCLTFPDGIGEKRETDRVDHDGMEAAVSELMARTCVQPVP